MMSYVAELVGVLVTRRKRMGIKRPDIAIACGQRNAVMGHIERSEIEPTISVLMDYAAEVGMALEWRLYVTPDYTRRGIR